MASAQDSVAGFVTQTGSNAHGVLGHRRRGHDGPRSYAALGAAKNADQPIRIQW
jgi:hypothetical protein